MNTCLKYLMDEIHIGNIKWIYNPNIGLISKHTLPRNILKDDRTKYTSEYPIVYPIALGEEFVYVICPICGKIHRHKIKNLYKYEGIRSLLCDKKCNKNFTIYEINRNDISLCNINKYLYENILSLFSDFINNKEE